MGQFLSTPSARRATFVNHEKHIVFVISIHALREEGDQSCTLNLPCHENFYPRPPRGGRPVNPVLCTSRQNFYPRPPRGGRLVLPCTGGPVQDISIHALREEGDYEAQNQCRPRTDFYPRPPRGGRRASGAIAALTSLFLSTPSARRATASRFTSLSSKLNFYPRPPRGGRLQLRELCGDLLLISIHALREEGDMVAPPTTSQSL